MALLYLKKGQFNNSRNTTKTLNLMLLNFLMVKKKVFSKIFLAVKQLNYLKDEITALNLTL